MRRAVSAHLTTERRRRRRRGAQAGMTDPRRVGRRRTGTARHRRVAGMARPLPAAGTVDGTGRRVISTRAEGISGGSTMAITPPSRCSIRCSEALVSGSSVCGYRCSDDRLTLF